MLSHESIFFSLVFYAQEVPCAGVTRLMFKIVVLLSVRHCALPSARARVYMSKCIYFFWPAFYCAFEWAMASITIFSPSTVDATTSPRRGKRRLAEYAGADNIFPIFKFGDFL